MADGARKVRVGRPDQLRDWRQALRHRALAVTTGVSPQSGGLARLTPELKVGNERVLHVFALN